MNGISALKKALLLGAAYAALLLLLQRAPYDHVAVMNAVIAERGGFASFELVHPLYTPLLALISGSLSVAGVSFPHMPAFQAFSGIFAGASVSVIFLLLSSCGLTAAAAASGALFAGFTGGFWFWAVQAKPYAPSLFFSLLAFYLLAGGRRRAAAASFAGACSFTLASASLAPAMLALLARGKTWKEGLRDFALFSAQSCAWLALLYAPLLLMKYRAISSMDGGLFHALVAVPGGGTILQSGSLSRQMSLAGERFFQGNYALAAAIAYGAAVFFFGKDRKTSPAFTLAAAGLALFFLFADPHNDYFYSVTVFAVLAAASRPAPRKLSMALPALTLLFAGFAIWSSASDRRGRTDIYRSEADFLAEKLGPHGTLFCAGPPDWRLAYLLEGRANLLQSDLGGNDGNPMTPELIPPGRELRGRLGAAFSSGRPLLLAADAMFRPDGLWTPEETQARVMGTVTWLEKNFTLGPPEISPNGQHYYPVMPGKAP